jgi:hypothetical protein
LIKDDEAPVVKVKDLVTGEQVELAADAVVTEVLSRFGH